MSWKPIVWNQADHYPQWLSHSSREGSPPQEGSRVTLPELPGLTLVAAKVETNGLVWLKPVRDIESY
jgi:hypothetical protein